MADITPDNPQFEDQSAVLTATRKMIAAWADNDADAFAEIFTEDATMILPGDVHLTGKEQIRRYMAAEYAGGYAGTTVTGRPLTLRRLADEVAVLTTTGGVLPAGAEVLPTERRIRATWVLYREGDRWLIAAYHNSPVLA